MTTHSSTQAVRQPTALETLSQIQAILELWHFSEQPEDIYSLNTVDAKDLGHGRDKACKTPPAGRPPGNDFPDDNLDDVNNNQSDDAPSINNQHQYRLRWAHQKGVQMSCPPTADSGSWAKVHEPKVYDSMDQAKLCTFFLQCMLNFQDRPSAFKTGASKIQCAISYLSGPTLQYFEPTILGEIYPEPTWLSNWDYFEPSLKWISDHSTMLHKQK